MTLTAPRLDLDLDGLPWLLGPTEARPAEEWVAELHPLLLRLLELDASAPDAVERSAAVRRVLTRVAETEATALPYRLLRWLRVEDPPMVASFGMSEAGDEAAYQEFLGAVDMDPVEPATVEEVAATGGRARRALSYSQPDTALFVELRYLLEPADGDVVVLLTTGARDPAQVVAAQEELDVLVSRMRVLG